MVNLKRVNMANQTGLSLIELMVSIVISSIVLGGVVGVVASSRGTYETEQESSFIQENGRFAIETIARDLRLAGSFGCADLDNARIANIAAVPDALFSAEAISGYEFSAVDTIAIPAPMSAQNVTSDIVIFRYADVDSAAMSVSHTPLNNSFTMVNAASFKAGEKLVVVDASCRYVSFFMPTSDTSTTVSYGLSAAASSSSSSSSSSTSTSTSTSSSGGPANCSTNIFPQTSYSDCPADNSIQRYSKGAEIMKYVTNAYFVSDSTVIPGMPSLKRLVSHGSGTRTEELAQGVESLEVRYGVDSTGDGIPNMFVDADAVSDWATVVSADVALVLRSQSQLAGLAVDAEDPDDSTDGFLRQALSTVIKMRNR